MLCAAPHRTSMFTKLSSASVKHQTCPILVHGEYRREGAAGSGKGLSHNGHRHCHCRVGGLGMSQTIPRVAYRGPREHQERPSKLQERVTEAAQRTKPTRRAKRAARMQTEKRRPVVSEAEVWTQDLHLPNFNSLLHIQRPLHLVCAIRSQSLAKFAGRAWCLTTSSPSGALVTAATALAELGAGCARAVSAST